MPSAAFTYTDRPRRHPHLRVRFAEPAGLVVECPPRSAHLELSRQAFDVLALCDGSRSVAELAGALPWGSLSAPGRVALLRRLLEQLRGVLLTGDDADSGELSPYYATYQRVSVHRTFVADRVRTQAYQDAITALVQPGDVVIDVGTGTGLLAFMAARAGASVVHAVEPTDTIEIARELARANGIENVEFHRAEAQALQLDQQVQLVICDWIGHFVFQERIFPALASVRDRLLAPGGRLLPGAVRLYLVPFEDARARAQGPEQWAELPWGIDLSSLRELEYQQLQSETRTLTPEQLLAGPALLDRFDALTLRPEQLVSWTSEPVQFTSARAGTIDGFCGFFVAEYAPGIELDTGPLAPCTFYQHLVFPTPPMPVKAGDAVSCTVDVSGPEAGWPVTTLRGEAGDAAFEHRYDEGDA